MKNGLQTVRSIVVNYCLLQRINSVHGTIINLKDEVFFIQSGKIKLYHGWEMDIEKAEITILNRGDKFHVPIGLKHRMFAIEDTELFEFSTEHSDSDSHRIMPGDLI